jgi:hypothetical protein
LPHIDPLPDYSEILVITRPLVRVAFVAQRLKTMLNELGAKGWELVASIPEDDATFLIFKKLR